MNSLQGKTYSKSIPTWIGPGDIDRKCSAWLKFDFRYLVLPLLLLLFLLLTCPHLLSIKRMSTILVSDYPIPQLYFSSSSFSFTTTIIPCISVHKSNHVRPTRHFICVYSCQGLHFNAMVEEEDWLSSEHPATTGWDAGCCCCCSLV